MTEANGEKALTLAILVALLCATRATAWPFGTRFFNATIDTVAVSLMHFLAMLFVVAGVTKGYAIIEFIAQIRKIGPGLDMVGGQLSATRTAALTGEVVSSEHILTPLFISIARAFRLVTSAKCAFIARIHFTALKVGGATPRFGIRAALNTRHHFVSLCCPTFPRLSCYPFPFFLGLVCTGFRAKFSVGTWGSLKDKTAMETGNSFFRAMIAFLGAILSTPRINSAFDCGEVCSTTKTDTLNLTGHKSPSLGYAAFVV